MKVLMHIRADDQDIAEALKKENEVAYSRSDGGFICGKDVCDALKSKYTGKIFARQLQGYLRMVYRERGEVVELKSHYSGVKIKHSMADDAGTATYPFEDDSCTEYETWIGKLFEADDWYEAITTEAKCAVIQMLMAELQCAAKSEIDKLKERSALS